jgi:hypothetical protein
MPYFRELPNLEYISVFKERNFNNEYTLAKNLFKRPKLREDLAKVVTAFEYYQIIGNERPDQIAEKYYSNAELDWVILITNNITNYNEEWPLDNDSLYKYMLDKYGSEEELEQVHHYETVEYKDDLGRVLIQGGLQVDPGTSEVIETTEESDEYILNAFPTSNVNQFVSVNLNQKVEITSRGNTIKTEYYITDINVNSSKLKYLPRNSNTYEEINIINNLANWPNGWGGVLTVFRREEENIEITIDDIILENKVRIPERLYEISGILVDGLLKPLFRFTNEIV